MKPISLEMTAFCSYCGTAKIDFTRLYDNGIFLITGKTGGGKTTILDAVCTALYGSATGSQRSKDWVQLRCINAPDHVPTVVEFVFCIAGITYKFRRVLRKVNSKKETVRFDDLNECYQKCSDSDEWKLIVSGKTKVNNEAERILNLTREQFVKVIMLPQGEFRELLVASTTEKGQILEKLFGTGHWKQITREMAKEQKRLEDLCKECEVRKDTALKGVQCESMEEMNAKREQTESSLTEYEKREKTNNLLIEEARDKLASAEKTAQQFDELTLKQKALEKLQSQADRIAEYERMLQYSRKLQNVLPEFDLLMKARSSAKITLQRLNDAKSAKNAADASLIMVQKKQEKLPELEARQKELIAFSTNLSELVKKRFAFDRTNRSLAGHNRELDALQVSRSELEKNRSDTEERIKKGHQFLAENEPDENALNDTIQKCAQLDKKLDMTKSYEEKKRRLDSAAQRLAQSEADIQKRRDELDSCKRTFEAVDHAIRCDRAYSLAKDLAEGVPCPVCGSIHHPSPALPAESVPTSADLEKCRKRIETAERNWQEAQKNHSDIAAEHNELTLGIEELRQKNAGEPFISSKQLEAECKAAQQECEKLKKMKSDYAKAQRRINDLVQQFNAVSKTITDADARINALNVQIAAEKNSVDSVVKELEAHKADSFDFLEAEAGRIQKEINATEKQIKGLNESVSKARTESGRAQAALEAAEKANSDAGKELRDCRGHFEMKCGEYGIPAQCNIRAEKLPDDRMSEYDGIIQSYRQDLFSTEERIHQLSEALDGRERPDLETLKNQYQALLKEVQSISAQIGSCKRIRENLEHTADTVIQCEKELEELTLQYSTAKRMCTLLSNEGNSLKMSIDIFVLSIKLERILVFANQYLEQLTNGQFTLKRKQEASGRDKYQGLDIEILDGSTGGVRAVSTLSGGETFLASLSLAFGLSDMVQSFAGGVHLDSLFIDEGFGTLDSDTLDTAMNAISKLGKNKLLGIISHVSELRERIPSGIEVIKTREGSSLRIRE